MRSHLLKFEAFAVAIIAIFSGVFLLQTYEYGRRAALFPRVVSITVLSLTGFFIVSRLRRATINKNVPAKESPARTEIGDEANQSAGVNWLAALGVAIGFFVLIYLVGFGPATLIYVSAHLYMAGYRRHGLIFLFAIAMAILVVATAYLFAVPVPGGMLVDMIAGARW